MKNCFLLLLLLLCKNASFAQTRPVHFGFKAGAEIGKIDIRPALDRRTEYARPGFHGGAFVDLAITEKTHIQIEALYKEHYTLLKFNPATTVKSLYLNLKQISVPVAFTYRFMPFLSAHVGGSINYNVYFSQEAQFTDAAYTRTFNITNEAVSFLPGALAGITYNAGKNAFVEARYHRMLSNLHKSEGTGDQTKYRLGSVEFSVGWRL